jgi:hypothetical protein
MHRCYFYEDGAGVTVDVEYQPINLAGKHAEAERSGYDGVSKRMIGT